MPSSIEEYYEKKLGWVPDFVSILSEYLPEYLEGYVKIRDYLLREPPEGALPLKFKELLIVVLDCVKLNVPGAEAHARAVIRAGGTVRELVESLAICALLTGMPTFEVAATKAIKAAESQLEKRGA